MLAPTSWFSILFPSVKFLKSCGRALTPGGAENRGSGDAAGPDGGRCFGTRELARRGASSGTVHHFRSVSYPRAFGRQLVNVARLWWPRALSQHSLSIHNKHCSLSVSATGKPGSDQLPPFFWCFICIYIYEYEYIVRMCMNVVVFLIHSEKYARYFYDISSVWRSLFFFSPLLLYFIFNVLSLALDTLHYSRNKKTTGSENPFKLKAPPPTYYKWI